MTPLTITVISIIACIFLLAFLLFLAHQFNRLFQIRFEGDVHFDFMGQENFPELKKEPIKILNDRDEPLHGAIFSYQRNKYEGVIIFYHGLFSGYLNYLQLIDYFAKKNYLIVAFDFTGCMSSGGKGVRGMPIVDHDNRSIINYVISHPTLKNYPIYTMGHSWGGHTAMTSLLHDDEHIKKAVAFNPYNSHIDCIYSIKPKLKILTPFIYLYFLLRFGHTSTYKVVDAMRYTSNPKMIICGDIDQIVKNKYAYHKFVKAQDENVNLRYLKGVTHFSYLSDEAGTYFTERISFPRKDPIDFKSLDCEKINHLNIHLLEEVAKFLKQ